MSETEKDPRSLILAAKRKIGKGAQLSEVLDCMNEALFSLESRPPICWRTGVDGEYEYYESELEAINHGGTSRIPLYTIPQG